MACGLSRSEESGRRQLLSLAPSVGRSGGLVRGHITSDDNRGAEVAKYRERLGGTVPEGFKLCQPFIANVVAAAAAKRIPSALAGMRSPRFLSSGRRDA
ncbi:hypothetical protein C8034_v002928 [Colletotrichum sidae]|uniref:Uncharacterized protein n=1 Tax=Colletotrichum sidae TaxID=1347389 RepID=A0A4R8TW53_9PEZI|nr:hypothetical protein C8034_v002928 [Colletotrichum sidae]